MKKFSKKIDAATCIFCGAPLTSSDHCNYCGSEYITQEAIEEIIHNIPNIIELEVNKIDISCYNSPDVARFYNHVIQISHITSPEISIAVDWKDKLLVRKLYDEQKPRHYKLIFGKHIIILEGAYIIKYIHFDERHMARVIYLTLIANKIMTS